MEKKQSGCINRDENAVNNMLKIVNHQIKYKERPLKYRRDYNLIKGSNPPKTKIIKSTKKSKLNKGQVEQLAL